MFLITRPPEQALELSQELAVYGVESQWLPLMEIVYNAAQIALASQLLNQAHGLLFISPTAINSVIDCLHEPRGNLYCVGQGSANLLAKHLGRKVRAPQNLSGVAGLIAEEVLLDCPQRDLVIIGGDELNPKLARYLTEQGFKYRYLSSYQRENRGLQELAQIEKIISQAQIMGIIVTSKLAAKYLLECGRQNSPILAALATTRLVSSHPEISTFLRQQGFQNICESTSPDNQAILQLVRNISDE